MLEMWNELAQELEAIRRCDPACRSNLEAAMCYPGFFALRIHGVCGWLWWRRCHLVARILSSVSRLATGIEIHPGATIGKRVFIDHGMGVVIGETAVVGDDCILYQGVTLGGTGYTHGKRHPTVENGVVIGAGAKILGNIVIGRNSRVGAGSVVLREVPENSTVVGVPGRIVRKKRDDGNALDHSSLPDAEGRIIKNLMERIDILETQIEKMSRYVITESTRDQQTGISETEGAQNLRDKEIIEYIGEEID